MMDIKPAKTPSDYKQIETLADTIWREHYIPMEGKLQVDYMLDKYQSVQAITKQIDQGFAYFLLKVEKTSVGYIAFKKENRMLFLSKIYVLKHYRGKKIGKRAMAFVEEQAKSCQLKSIRLTVNKHNTGAIHAYQQLGFKNMGSVVLDIGNGFVMDDFEMEKHIPD